MIDNLKKKAVTALGGDVLHGSRGHAASDLLTAEEVEAILCVRDSVQRQDVFSEADILWSIFETNLPIRGTISIEHLAAAIIYAMRTSVVQGFSLRRELAT
jgi:hypothetical protein